METDEKPVSENEQKYCCPVEATLGVIGGKWKPLILWQLKEDILRFNSLQQTLPGISPKMLTKQLRELENDGLVGREMYPEIPPESNTHLPILEERLFPCLKHWLNGVLSI
jgi:transcriptional regulator, MarR family